MHNRNILVLLGGIGVFACLFVGLSLFLTWVSTPREEITTQVFDRRIGTPIDAPPAHLTPVRFLGAMIPHEDRVWFFKTLAPADTPDSVKKQFAAFLKTISFPDEKPIAWKTPEAWKQEPGGTVSGIRRFATIWLPNGAAEPLEVAVSYLDRRPNSILSNLNRWRKQVGLPELRFAGDVDKAVHRMDTPAAPILLVDMAGAGDLTGFGPPPMAAGHDEEERLPFAITTPPNWRETTPADKFSMMAFAISRPDDKDGRPIAAVTITPFAGDGGGWDLNIERWAKQVGLPPLKGFQIDAQTKVIEAPGGTIRWIDLQGPKEEGKRFNRVLAAGVFLEWEVYIVKMVGSSEDLDLLKPQFEAFLRSARFRAKGGD